jgi:hypothetical protein
VYNNFIMLISPSDTPDTSGISSLHSVETIDYSSYTPLLFDQVDRAYDFWVSSERIHTLQKEKLKALKYFLIFRTLGEEILWEFAQMKKLLDLSRESRGMEVPYVFPARLRKDIPPIIDRFGELFTEEAIFVSSFSYYAANREEAELYRFITFMLNVWNSIPSIKHGDVFNSRNEKDYPSYSALCRLYLDSRKGDKLICSIPGEKDGYIHNVQVAKSIDTLGKENSDTIDHFSRFSVRIGSPIEDEIRYLEEIFILGSWVPEVFFVSDKVRNIFLQKHLKAIRANTWLRALVEQKFWEDTVRKIIDPTVAKPTRSKSLPTKPGEPQTERRAYGTEDEKSMIPQVQKGFVFSAPDVTKNLKELLKKTKENTVEIRREEAVRGIPYSEMVSLFVLSPDEEWRATWKSYKKGDSLMIVVQSEFEYQFVLGKSDESLDEVLKKNPLTKFRFEKKIHEVREATLGNTHAILTPRETLVSFWSKDNTRPREEEKRDTLPHDLALTILEGIIEDSLLVGEEAWGQALTLWFMYEGKNGYLRYQSETQSISYIFDGKPVNFTEFDDIASEVWEYCQKKSQEILSAREEEISEILSVPLDFIGALIDDILPEGKEKGFRYDNGSRNIFVGNFVDTHSSWKAQVEQFRWLSELYSIHIHTEKIGNEISISASLKWETRVSASLRTIPGPPFYVQELDPSFLYGEAVRERLSTLLENIFFLYGALGERILWASHNPKKTIKWIHNDDISKILSGSMLPKNSLTYNEGVMGRKREFIIDAYTRLKSDAWGKLINRDGKIQSNMHLSDLDGSMWVVIVDDRIISSDSPGSGEVYEKIQTDIRLRKYLILRMYATIIGREYAHKTPLTGNMRRVFLQVWQGLSPEKKQEFLEYFSHNGASAGNALLMMDGETSFFDRVFFSWKAENVGMHYLRPQIMKVSDFQSFIKKNSL